MLVKRLYKMFPVSVARNALRNYVADRLPGLSCRVKSSAAVSELLKETASDDLPTLDQNPFKREERQCILCKYGIEPDYKNVRLLSQFQSRHTGKIYGSHITGLCKRKQLRVEQEIMKAQNAGLMGYMTKDPRYVNDPKLFDPNNPFKPHKY